jgi:hypothetical protein
MLFHMITVLLILSSLFDNCLDKSYDHQSLDSFFFFTEDFKCFIILSLLMLIIGLFPIVGAIDGGLSRRL